MIKEREDGVAGTVLDEGRPRIARLGTKGRKEKGRGQKEVLVVCRAWGQALRASGARILNSGSSSLYHLGQTPTALVPSPLSEV